MTLRLIGELKKDFDNPLLIDGFFLLGVLSVDNRLKVSPINNGAGTFLLTDDDW